ncbi:hypothetical protein [Streptomyces sp. IBSBF 3136]|uniref:hypothetical protein n=1 Tax=Streptomyces sp. IBSBF 3136 TaxID=2903524 RepID=UPI002FDC2A7D
MSNHSALILLACFLAVLVAALTGAEAGYLGRRDHATYPAALTRGAAAFGATLLLFASVASTLIHR